MDKKLEHLSPTVAKVSITLQLNAKHLEALKQLNCYVNNWYNILDEDIPSLATWFIQFRDLDDVTETELSMACYELSQVGILNHNLDAWHLTFELNEDLVNVQTIRELLQVYEKNNKVQNIQTVFEVK